MSPKPEMLKSPHALAEISPLLEKDRKARAALAGNVVAIRTSYKHKPFSNDPDAKWLESNIALKKDLASRGYQFVAEAGILGHQWYQTGQILRLKEAGYYMLYQLPEKSTLAGKPLEFSGRVISNASDSLIVSLRPPTLFNYEKFLKGLASWGDEAIRRFDRGKISLQLIDHPWLDKTFYLQVTK